VIAGMLVGLAGVALLFSDSTTFNFSQNKFPVICIFVLMVGNILWVIGSLIIKYNIKGSSPTVNASLQMMAAGIALLITAFALGEHSHFDIHTISMKSGLSLLYLIVFGSLIAYSAFVWLLEVRPPSIVGSHALVNPVVAVLLGSLLVDEKFNTTQMIALFIILAGVVMVNYTRVGKEGKK
jgi:drug/metabolite transporter (DMT)-like permease